jgi:hypothetical protein
MDDRAASGDLDAPQVSREELLASMPLRVRRAFPQFDWTEEALWRLQLPVEELPVETFDWLLDLPIWRWQGRRFQISMQDVLSDPAQYRAHHEKAERADTAHPIHVTWYRRRWVILDGYHRLLRTIVEGRRTIKAVKVRAEDLASGGVD